MRLKFSISSGVPVAAVTCAVAILSGYAVAGTADADAAAGSGVPELAGLNRVTAAESAKMLVHLARTVNIDLKAEEPAPPWSNSKIFAGFTGRAEFNLLILRQHRQISTALPDAPGLWWLQVNPPGSCSSPDGCPVEAWGAFYTTPPTANEWSMTLDRGYYDLIVGSSGGAFGAAFNLPNIAGSAAFKPDQPANISYQSRWGSGVPQAEGSLTGSLSSPGLSLGNAVAVGIQTATIQEPFGLGYDPGTTIDAEAATQCWTQGTVAGDPTNTCGGPQEFFLPTSRIEQGTWGTGAPIIGGPILPGISTFDYNVVNAEPPGYSIGAFAFWASLDLAATPLPSLPVAVPQGMATAPMAIAPVRPATVAQRPADERSTQPRLSPPTGTVRGASARRMTPSALGPARSSALILVLAAAIVSGALGATHFLMRLGSAPVEP
ncbi:MAG: hypothetical protein ACYDAY_11720 [Candidatus Dormibacteria bacterium]